MSTNGHLLYFEGYYNSGDIIMNQIHINLVISYLCMSLENELVNKSHKNNIIVLCRYLKSFS